jgi:hypothetical protein
MPTTKKVTPTCCEAVQESKSVFLEYEIEDLRSGVYHDKEPDWVAAGFNAQTDRNFPVVVSFCPHCGTALPRLKRRRGRMAIAEINMLEGKCDHCHKRLMECRCLPPEFAYEPDTGQHARSRV